MKAMRIRILILTLIAFGALWAALYFHQRIDVDDARQPEKADLAQGLSQTLTNPVPREPVGNNGTRDEKPDIAPPSTPEPSIADLLSRSRSNDLIAAKMAYEKLAPCRDAKRNLGEVDVAVRKIYPRSTPNNSEEIESTRSAMLRLMWQCQKFSDSQIKSENGLMIQLTRGGDRAARYRYYMSLTEPAAEDLTQEEVEAQLVESDALFQQEILSGDRGAMVIKAQALNQGRRKSPDLVESYKYLYLYGLSSGNRQDTPGATTALERLEHLLNPALIEQARADAALMYKKCCM